MLGRASEEKELSRAALRAEATRGLGAGLTDPRVIASTMDPVDLQATDGAHVRSALQHLSEGLGWARDGKPFGAIVPSGGRVVIKPNLVHHENLGGHGTDCLYTAAGLIRAVAQAALDSGAGQVVVGDAPIQGCDLEALLAEAGLKKWARDLASRFQAFVGIRDFRRTTCTFVDGVRIAAEGKGADQDFVLFDLGRESCLEPITQDGRFRVTCYDPRGMAATHAPGRHQYLVTRDILDADLVVNLPKLKTHKKVGVTCALKNLVGINGNKEYLPHHRLGGSKTGGDCYPGRSWVKRAHEFFLDQLNMASSHRRAQLWRWWSVQADRASWLLGDRLGVDGSWSGNDTVWRMCLDLNRIVLYGRPDGTLALEPQRRLIHIADAVTAGQGEGPLAPEPLPLGLLLAASNAAAMDFAGARLLGYDPVRLPVVRQAFETRAEVRPLTTFPLEAVTLDALSQGVLKNPPPVKHPLGWRSQA